MERLRIIRALSLLIELVGPAISKATPQVRCCDGLDSYECLETEAFLPIHTRLSSLCKAVSRTKPYATMLCFCGSLCSAPYPLRT